MGDYVLLQFEQIAAKTFVLSKHFIQISIVRLENKERDVLRKKLGRHIFVEIHGAKI